MIIAAVGVAGFAVGFGFWWFLPGGRHPRKAGLFGLALGGFSAAGGSVGEKAAEAAGADHASEAGPSQGGAP